ncbi:MAG: peptide deformylase [Rubellimicrobium sp.]|nr:peptide deformylase [Rubellimicrobium sp.]
MTHRPFVLWPDPVLRRPARPVGRITPEIHALWDEMVLAMENMPGVGLAAVQLGVPLALAVVDASAARGQAVRMADPVLIHASPETEAHEEGSPNLPGVSAPVHRPRTVRVRFLGVDGTTGEREFAGLWAASALHQIDHLAGRMYFDRLGRVKRDMLLRRARKLAS